MTTYVLVHGSCLGGWIWQRVRPLLEQRGHRVLAPSLTGLADRGHLAGPDVGLSVHIDDIARLMAWEDLHDVVLVGASYAGMVITGVAGVVPERIAELVYLDGFRLTPGQSAFDQLPHLAAQLGEPSAAHPWEFGLPDLRAFGLDDPADRDWIGRLSTPMPNLTHREALPIPQRVPEKALSITYIQGATLPIFDQVADQAEADGATVLRWTDASHLLPVTHAERVAEALFKGRIDRADLRSA
jgi:pimeloyl-ACP methyl ester carboxylesterase